MNARNLRHRIAWRGLPRTLRTYQRDAIRLLSIHSLRMTWPQQYGRAARMGMARVHLLIVDECHTVTGNTWSSVMPRAWSEPEPCRFIPFHLQTQRKARWR